MGVFDSLFRRQLVGLDIGVSGIKAVELQGEKEKTPRLVAYNRVPLPWDSVLSDGEIKDRGAVISALLRLFDARIFSSKRVVLGARGNSVITKKITVPRMTEDELNNQLYWEAEQYLPFSIDEVNIDFVILGNSTQTHAEGPMMDVLLVGAKKDYIQSLTSLIEEAGLVTEVVDIQAFALGNVFEFNYRHLIERMPEAASVIIDFGAGSTKLSVVEGDKTVFTRELRQCGMSCTSLLSERLNVDLEEAERIKITQASSDAVRPIVVEYANEMAEEISRTLDYCISQSADRAIDGIYVCGGVSRMEGLAEILNGKLPVPVQALNPIQNLAGSGKKMNAQAIRELSYLGAVAIGLSLRSVGDSQ